MTRPTFRQKLGCWLNERWRAELVLRTPGLAKRLGLDWLDLCNRHESLVRHSRTIGRRCEWSGTSRLTVCRLFPRVGDRLLHRLLAEWPIRFADPSKARSLEGVPRVSIIIPIRGRDRLPQLRYCLSTLFAQRGCRLEILVVEQDRERLIQSDLPEGIRYFHARSEQSGADFNKSWALNVGARMAGAEYLLFHDADMLAPSDYVRSVCGVLDQGFEAVRPVRLVVDLNKTQTERLYGGGRLENLRSLSDFVQNCPALFAVRKRAYWRIGGHDEAFSGWGGEDDELVQRLRTQRLWEGGFAPLVHLWHPPQSGKSRQDPAKVSLIEAKARTTVEERISDLAREELGGLSTPHVTPLRQRREQHRKTHPLIPDRYPDQVQNQKLRS